METKSKISTPLITYIHEISGQLRRQNIIESEHAYAKFWNRHPDPTNKSRPARFLFMQSFARWSTFEGGGGVSDFIDVDSVDEKLFLTSNPIVNPLVSEVAALTKGQVTITEEFAVTDSSPNKSTWSNLAQRIWAKALNILYTDRLIRLSIEGTPNEIITKKMISHKCANKFRHLFASLAFWDPSILSWLHGTLLEHVSGQYLIAYHESMQLLRSRFPSIIDRFYLSPVHNDPIRSRNKGPMLDPIQNVLNNHKPKRIKNCPLFILVPNGPQQSNSILPQRLKHWQLLFASLGKIITLSINYRPTMRVKDCLNEIMIGVRDKIAECRTTFTEGRPIILVGFGHSSLIATHVALDSTCKVTATICLGFPLAGVNGFRGDLDDPLLDTTVPTLFVIGQNATLSSIDDVEDFRERITKTETGLIVVGGANDHLVVSQTKQRFTGITQAIVDRCISDEIYDFINFVMNPHFVPSENNYVSAAAKNLSKTSPGDGEKTTKSKSKSLTKSKSKSKVEKQTSNETLPTPTTLDRQQQPPLPPLPPPLLTASTHLESTFSPTPTSHPPLPPLIIAPSTSVEGATGTGSGADAGPVTGLGAGIGANSDTASGSVANPSPGLGSGSGAVSGIASGITPLSSKRKKTTTSKFGAVSGSGVGADIAIGNTPLSSKRKKTSTNKFGSGAVSASGSSAVTGSGTGPVSGDGSGSSTVTGASSVSVAGTGTTGTSTGPVSVSSAVSVSVSISGAGSSATGDTGSGSGVGIASGTTPLPSKRKKTSTSKFDPDGLQPAKKKREDPVMSISSIEKIERTLDEVIATSMLEFQPTPPSLPIEPTITTTTTTTIPTPTPTPTPTPAPTTTTHTGCYEESEVIALPPCSANTRTRTIRAPKQLDI